MEATQTDCYYCNIIHQLLIQLEKIDEDVALNDRLVNETENGVFMKKLHDITQDLIK